MFPIPVSNRPIVQKYGGTSVGSVARIDDVARRVKRTIEAGHHQVAVVVSAMSGETNRLVDLMRQVNDRAPARAYDMAVAAGEQVSVALLAAALEKIGIEGVPLLAYQLGILTDRFHARARIQSIKTDRLIDCWRQNQVPIVAGFQGVTEDLDITTLGRGGSDTSAVALAAALDAAFCEINTDVDGVFTADPRVVPTARLLPKMDYEVALEMAALGSKVLHPRCVELGAKYQLPLIVRNSFKPDDARSTCVMSNTSNNNLESPVVSGVTVDRNVVKITLDGIQDGPGVIARIFSDIAKAGINVDIIVHNHGEKGNQRLGFTTEATETRLVVETLEKLFRSTSSYGDVVLNTEGELAKVSIVGVGMRSHPGVAGQMFKALADQMIPIKMISTSEIKVSCVVPAELGDFAAKACHAIFIA